MDVPATLAEISGAWLEAALVETHAFRDVSISAARAVRIGEGYGLDGIVGRVEFDVGGGTAPASIVAKLGRAKRGREEIDFYERIAPRFPARLARFHAGFVDADADRGVLLLEDLTSATQGDAVVGGTRDQVAAALRVAAAYHTRFLGADERELPLSVWPGRGTDLVECVAARLQRFEARYGEGIDQRARRAVAELTTRLPDALRHLSELQPTLIHGDLHLDNVLFLADGEAVILDWPEARRGPGLVDVVRLFVEGMTVEARREHADGLLAEYLAACRTHGQPEPSPLEVQATVRAAVLWHLAYAVLWGGAERPGFDEARVKAIVDSLVRNTTGAAADLL